MTKYGYIYKVCNLHTGDIYVGKHKYSKEGLDPYYKGSGLILNNQRKYQEEDSFETILLEDCYSLAHLNEREIYWINYYRSNSDKLINIAAGGDGGDITSQFRWYNNGVENLYIKLTDNIPEGFIPGRLYFNNSSKGKILVNNGLINKQIYPEELDNYLNKGFVKGIIDRGESWRSKVGQYKRTEEIIDKQLQARRKTLQDNPERKSSSIWKSGQEPHNKNTICITNGERNKYIKELELSDWVNKGWWKGSTQHHKIGEKSQHE